MPIESVMPSNHLILCHPLLPPSIIPSIRVFSNESFASMYNSWLFWWLSGKESACQCRRHEFSPWSRNLLGRRKWQPAPVFLTGNPMDRETWAVSVYVVIKSGTSLSDSLTSYIIHSRIANNLILTIVFVIVMDLIFWWYKIYSMGIFRNMKSKPNFCSGSFCMCMYL